MIWQYTSNMDTHQGINISHLGNRKIIFKSTFKMGYVSSQEGSWKLKHIQTLPPHTSPTIKLSSMTCHGRLPQLDKGTEKISALASSKTKRFCQAPWPLGQSQTTQNLDEARMTWRGIHRPVQQRNMWCKMEKCSSGAYSKNISNLENYRATTTADPPRMVWALVLAKKNDSFT